MQKKTRYQEAYNFGNSLGRLSREILYNIRRILNKRFEEAGFKITSTEWTIITYLHNKAHSQIDLVKETGWNKVAINRLIRNLHEQKIVDRQILPTDRRFNIIVLTELGEEIYNQLSHIAAETISEARNTITNEEFKMCINLMQKITKNLKQL